MYMIIYVSVYRLTRIEFRIQCWCIFNFGIHDKQALAFIGITRFHYKMFLYISYIVVWCSEVWRSMLSCNGCKAYLAMDT